MPRFAVSQISPDNRQETGDRRECDSREERRRPALHDDLSVCLPVRKDLARVKTFIRQLIYLNTPIPLHSVSRFYV